MQIKKIALVRLTIAVQYITRENKLKTVVILKENQRQDVIGSENLSDRPTESEGRREQGHHCVFPVYLGVSGPAGVSM